MLTSISDKTGESCRSLVSSRCKDTATPAKSSVHLPAGHKDRDSLRKDCCTRAHEREVKSEKVLLQWPLVGHQVQ